MKKILPLLILSFTLFSCSKEKPVPTLQLSATPTALSFTTSSETKTIAVTSNVMWSATSSDPSWCMALKSEGKNNEQIDIRVTGYNTVGVRNATITLSSSENIEPVIISVTQAGIAKYIQLNKTSFTAEPAGQALKVDFITNINENLSVTANEGWIHATELNMQEQFLTLTIDPNTFSAERSGTVTISGDGVPSQTISIKQDAIANGSRQADSLALVSFYNVAKPHLNWDFHKPMNTWGGIHLNPEGRVDTVSIDYKASQVPFYDGGTLSPELGNLVKLVKLVLLTDGLTGSIPKEIGNLKNLKELKVASALLGENSGGITGAIPSELGNLSKLEVLYLQDLKITGGIPSAIGDLINLQTLVLQSNKQLGGSIPASLGQLSHLIDLILTNDALTGTLPKEIGQLSQLNYLWLYANQLSDAIPNEISNLKKLMELFIYENQLTALPADFTNMTNLELVYAHNNLLAGTLPNSMNKLTKLTYITLQNNKFTGEIPSSFGQLGGLALLSLYNNLFSGNIPSTFGAASYSLVYLLLNKNSLSGTIPASIDACPRLQYFQVQNNSLSGSIPATILSKFGSYKDNFCPQVGVGFDNYDCSGIANPQPFSISQKTIVNAQRYNLNLQNTLTK